MPEVAEVELITRSLASSIVSKHLIKAHSLHKKYDEVASSLEGCRLVTNIQRRGKFILVELDYQKELIIHLGMTGQVLLTTRPTEGPHTHFEILLSDSTYLYFKDPRRFGKLSVVPKGKYTGLLSKLGPEIGATEYSTSILRSKKSIFALLLDQQFLAGVGSYVAQEMLFDAKIRPDRCGTDLNADHLGALAISALKVKELALSKGGLSFSDFRHTDGSSGQMRRSLKVYKRGNEDCHICSDRLATMKLAGRTVTFCSRCQK